MKDKALAKRDKDAMLTPDRFIEGGEVALAKKFFPKIASFSDEKIAMALLQCVIRKENPFGGECNIITRGDSLSVETTFHSLLAKATQDPNFKRTDDGVLIIQTPEGKKVRNPGPIQYVTGSIAGGDATIFYKDGSQQTYAVPIGLYKFQSKNWIDTGYMMCKVAIANALRKGVPICSGLITKEEMDYTAIPQEGSNEPAGATTEEQEVYIVQDGEERVPQAIEPPQEAKPEPKPEKPKRGRSSAPPSPKSKPAPQTKAAPQKKEVQSEPLAKAVSPPPQEPPSQEANGYDGLIELLRDPLQDSDIARYWLDKIAKVRAGLAADITKEAQTALEEQLRENIKKAAG